MASPEYNMFFDHVDSPDGESSSSSAESEGFLSLDKNNNVKQHEQSGTHSCRVENYKDQGQSVSIRVRVSKHTGPGGNSPLSPRSDSRSKPSTSYSPILPSSTQSTSSAQRRWSHCDTLDGDQLDSIAKGMRSNERISKQKKGVRIAGRRLGKVKSKRRKKENNTEPGASGDRRKARKSDKATSRASVSEKCSPRRHGQEEKKRRKRRRKRLHPQPPPEGQVRRSESLYKLATNPCHLDPNMEHNKTVHTQFGGHITQLTEPQPKIRRRRRSNQVKDPQMDFDL